MSFYLNDLHISVTRIDTLSQDEIDKIKRLQENDRRGRYMYINVNTCRMYSKSYRKRYSDKLHNSNVLSSIVSINRICVFISL